MDVLTYQGKALQYLWVTEELFFFTLYFHTVTSFLYCHTTTTIPTYYYTVIPAIEPVSLQIWQQRSRIKCGMTLRKVLSISKFSPSRTRFLLSVAKSFEHTDELWPLRLQEIRKPRHNAPYSNHKPL